MERIASLEKMLNMSSKALAEMASQLSEAEERERALVGRGRWNHLRFMGDAKNLLQYMFNVAAETRYTHNLEDLNYWTSEVLSKHPLMIFIKDI